MSNKSKKSQPKKVLEDLNKEEVISEEVVAEEVAPVKAQPEKATKEKVKNTKKKEKKPNVLVKKVKETGSELKKVSWPNFSTVVKKTGVVIAVVIIFTAVIFGIDRLLSFLFDLLTKSLG